MIKMTIIAVRKTYIHNIPAYFLFNLCHEVSRINPDNSKRRLNVVFVEILHTVAISAQS